MSNNQAPMTKNSPVRPLVCKRISLFGHWDLAIGHYYILRHAEYENPYFSSTLLAFRMAGQDESAAVEYLAICPE
jgi:hypothetical protein